MRHYEPIWFAAFTAIGLCGWGLTLLYIFRYLRKSTPEAPSAFDTIWMSFLYFIPMIQNYIAFWQYHMYTEGKAKTLKFAIIHILFFLWCLAAFIYQEAVLKPL